MASKHQDKILLGLALLLVAGGGVGAWYYYDKQTLPALKPAAKYSGVLEYKPKVKPVTIPETESWSQPGAQSSGKDWIYEVFTSPHLYYDEVSKEIKAVPPVFIPPPKPFGLGLVRVLPGPFRLQLVGQKGEDGVFEDLIHKDTIIARAGRNNSPLATKQLADLKLEIRDYQVKEVPHDESDPTSSRIRIVVATLADTETGATYVLDNRTRRMGGAPSVILMPAHVPGQPDKELEPLKVGGTYTATDGAIFTIDAITETPPSITVTKRVAGQPDRTVVLDPLPPRQARRAADVAEDQRAAPAKSS